MKKVSRSNRKGFSMVELLLVFAVILGAAVMVFVAYPKLKANQAATTENTNLSTLQAGIKNIFQGKPNYTGLVPTVLINAQVVPNTMVNGTNIVNSWGATVAIAPATLGGLANNAYSITYPSVPQDVCVKLASSSGLNFDTVTIGTTAVKTFGSMDVDVVATTTACAAGGAANSIVMVAR
jgi:type II secretory pathway pseudopilin PulG